LTLSISPTPAWRLRSRHPVTDEMGLFSSSKSSTPAPADKVWKNRDACLKGLATQALLSLRDGRIPVVITFFDEAHDALLDFMSKTGVPFRQADSFAGVDVHEGKNVVVVMKAAAAVFPAGIHKHVKASVFLLGRYPLAEIENKIIEQAAAHFPGSPICFCVSLGDPFFETFGSQNVLSLMDTLGMKDDEFIEHKLVSKAIRNAQDKIAKDILVEFKSRSEKEWFQKNIKKT
jgi:hypothetical protein